ncbi:uncharacterized protein LOC112503755 [Cynara cardunculus var. scolymus]|uniref:uncharacterized protein LOC112503755 n=1 Tax=Cynara cardunculus var. scolymus TaxID=59895 RepID=UPI000D622EDC|nr:uncharacterized protein LOC112503755 [Cynara cardunculus var. scolymus]
MQIEKRIEKLKKSKANNSQTKVKEEAEKSALERIQQALMDGKPARSVPLTEFEKESMHHLCLLTMKPVVYVANVAESDLAKPESNPHVENVMKLASELQSGLVAISAPVLRVATQITLGVNVHIIITPVMFLAMIKTEDAKCVASCILTNNLFSNFLLKPYIVCS